MARPKEIWFSRGRPSTDPKGAFSEVSWLSWNKQGGKSRMTRERFPKTLRRRPRFDSSFCLAQDIQLCTTYNARTKRTEAEPKLTVRWHRGHDAGRLFHACVYHWRTLHAVKLPVAHTNRMLHGTRPLGAGQQARKLRALGLLAFAKCDYRNPRNF